MNKRKTGTEYEELAARWLIEKGYEILEKNYRCRIGEIDLIARDGRYLVFVEVKYRSDEKAGDIILSLSNALDIDLNTDCFVQFSSFAITCNDFPSTYLLYILLRCTKVKLLIPSIINFKRSS